MSNWRVAKLQGGYAFKSSDSAENGTRWLKIANVGKGEVKWEEQSYLPKHFEKEHSNFLLAEGDSVVALTRPITQGELKVAQIRSSDVPALINQRVARVLPKHHLVERDFMYALLRYEAIVRDIEITIFGTDPPNVSTKQIEELKINLPPLPEQQKIAAILTSVDEVIEKTQAQINKLKDLKTGMMQELLTRGVGVDGKPHTEFKESPVGRIPKAWDVRCLPELATYQNGKAFPSSDYLDSTSNGYYLVKPVNLDPDGKINWSYNSSAKLSKDYWNEASTYRVGSNEILMNLTAQSLEDDFLGRVCLTEKGEKCILNQRIARIKTKNDLEILQKYLFWAFKGTYFRSYIERVTQGSKVQHLYNSNLDQALIAFPSSIDEQFTICKSLDSVEALICKKTKKQKSYINTKKALMQDLLTGKVRVKVDS